MLELKDPHKTFNPGTVNAKTALDGLSLTLRDGEFVTVIGGNGAGKSTMLNAAGTLSVDSGEVHLDSVDVTDLPEYKRAAYIGRMFQDPMMGTAPSMHIEENLALAARRGQKRAIPRAAGRSGTRAGDPTLLRGQHPVRRPAPGADAADGHAEKPEAAGTIRQSQRRRIRQ